MSSQTLVSDQKARLPIMAHVICGWPLILVAVGGAIGGGMGGAAYAVNLAIYKSDMPGPAKVLLNLLVGGLAVVGWIVAASFIQKALK